MRVAYAARLKLPGLRRLRTQLWSNEGRLRGPIETPGGTPCEQPSWPSNEGRLRGPIETALVSRGGRWCYRRMRVAYAARLKRTMCALNPATKAVE